METLCSLHAIGELSASERRELDRHLIGCKECRLMLQDFEQIALLDLTVIAATRAEQEHFDDHALQNPDRVLSRVLNQGDAPASGLKEIPEAVLPASLGTRPHHRRRRLFDRSNLWPSLGWAVACLALVVAGYFAVQAKRTTTAVRTDLSAALEHEQSETQAWKLRSEQIQTQEQLSVQLLDRSEAQKAATQATLETLRASYSDLLQRQATLEQQLAGETASLTQKETDLQTTRASLDQERQRVKLLNTELQNATTSVAEARDRIAHMVQVSDKAAAPASAPEPRVTDADAREIFGARDLHIVDVYDTDRSGKTRRTYGRVYYVNRSLLLFYAFDLNDRKNNRKAAGFQAWGFREPNSSKPENLGLFYVDDASLNRWVLRVTDAEVLSRIDTVFVTLEPPQGSEFPRGPKLLFASLGGPANHP
jgi:anti-sigma-K factor RskA